MKISYKYAPRDIQFTGLVEIQQCIVKRYAICYSSNTMPTQEEWETAEKLYSRKRMEFQGSNEANYGYLILHKGMDCNYCVCCWWSHENMLRLIPYRAELHTPLQYTRVKDGLDICAWDMLVHHYERNSFVHHILSFPEQPKIKQYVHDHYPG